MIPSSRQASAAEKVSETGPRYEELPFSLVDTDPDQPRQDFFEGDILLLAGSIEDNSLLQAVTVKDHPTSPGRYIIVAGERRFRAMKLLGKVSATFKILDSKSAAKSYLLSAIENLHRVNLNPIEEALCYQRLHDQEGMTWEEVGKLTGRDITSILNKVKLLTLPPEVVAMVRKGNLPQVTALNLTQWRNDEGEYLRMAHDLIAGRSPTELSFRKDTALSAIQVNARLPKTPEDFGTRIVRLSGSIQSMPAVLEAFFLMSQEEQERALTSINPSVLGKIRVRFQALSRVVQAFSERLEPKKVPKSATPAQPVAKPVVTASFTSGKAVELLPPLRKEIDPPPASVPRRPTVHRDVQLQPPSADDIQAPPKEFEDKQSLDLTREVWVHLIYSGYHDGGGSAVNLSRKALERMLKGCRAYQDQPMEEVVRNTVMSARHRWGKAISGTPENQDLARRMHAFRRESGNCATFEEAFDRAVSRDRSSDPVRLPAFH